MCDLCVRMCLSSIFVPWENVCVHSENVYTCSRCENTVCTVFLRMHGSAFEI